MKKVIIIMPVANEEATMAGILDQILKLPYDNLYVYPILDKYSHDSTEAIVDDYEIKTNHRIHKVFYEASTGIASCILKGYEDALKDNADYIIEMDGGGSHSPEALPKYIELLDQGYDCVWGSRFIDGGMDDNMPWYRRLLSRGGTVLANLVLGTKLRDMTSGFEGFKADILRQFNFSNFLSKGHMYNTEIRYYCRSFKSIENPIHYVGGNSSLKAKTIIKALGILFKLKTNEANVRYCQNIKELNRD